MNENPGGTPNPLNQNPAPQPVAGPAPQPVPPAQPVPPVPPAPATPTAQPAEPVVAPAPVDPTAAPNAQAPTDPATSTEGGDKSSKKKIGLIAAIVLFVVAIVCAVLAVVVINPFKGDDRVPQAISKLISGGTPKNVQVKGKVVIDTTNEDTTLRSLTIDLDAKFATEYSANTATAEVIALFADETELRFNAEEIRAADGDIYLNIKNLADSLEDADSGAETLEAGEENCETDEDGETNCEVLEDITTTCEGDACEEVEGEKAGETGYLGVLIDYFDLVDDTWIRIPADLMGMPEEEIGIFNNESQCLVDAVAKLPNYNNSIAEAYKTNQFIEYSTEDLGIESVANNLYRLSFNDERLANFINQLSSSALVTDVLACTDSNAKVEEVTTEQVTEILSDFPTIYVEIDENYNFTRVVLDAKIKDQSAKARVDFALSYPDVITVTEPEEYVDLNDFLVELFGNLYGITTEDETEVIVGE